MISITKQALGDVRVVGHQSKAVLHTVTTGCILVRDTVAERLGISCF